MKNLFLPLLFLFLSAGIIKAQEEQEPDTWRVGGVLSVNFSQSSFTNWAAGGENSYGGNAFVNLFANYKAVNYSWDNTLDLGFGLTQQASKPLYKTDDKINFSSKYGYRASEKWYYSALVGFNTQFYEGKKSIDDTTKISNFMAPAYLTLSIGMDYKPIDNFSLFISPITERITFVLDTVLSNQGAYGVEPGKKARFELGGLVRAIYRVEFWTNVTYATKLELFTNYLDKPQNIDVNWENLLTFKINDFLSANLALTLMYDDDARFPMELEDGTIKETPRLQIREVFGVGLTYRF